MNRVERTLEYNREISSGLKELWGLINHGQQKQLLKRASVKALLIRYGAYSEVDDANK